MIRQLVAEGTTVLLTTQYLEEADRLADEIVVVDRGRVIAAGTPLELKSRIGGHVIEVRPTDPEDVPAARRILEDFDADGSVHSDGQLVAATIADRSALSTVARRLDEVGVAVDDLSLRRRSLDEVFLALTGHTATEHGAGNGSHEGSAP